MIHRLLDRLNWVLLFAYDPKTVGTVELQWLEHLRNLENMLETGVVRANECSSLFQIRRHNRDVSFRISLI